MPLTEVSQQLSAIPGGNPPGDWQSAVGWGDPGFEPGTAGQQSGMLPLSHHASLEPPRLPENITEAKDEGKSVDVIYLDFSKALVKVPHKGLLKKMEAKNVSKEVLEGTKSCLSQCKQKVKVNGELSEGDVDSEVS